MKIVVSYSRRDAGDFANQIRRHLSTFNYDVFTDVDSIRAGEVWSNTIEQNISNCDIFVVIITDGALQSPYVEREVLQAQRENKTIIPCFHKDVIDSDIKWGLDKIQGVEFDDKYELARHIRSKISNLSGKNGIFGSTSKTVDEAKTQASKTTSKANTEKIPQQKDSLPQSSSKYLPSESHNSEESSGIDSRSGKRSQAINLKIIIIPIVAVIGIVGIILAFTIFSSPPSPLPSSPSSSSPLQQCGKQLPGVILFGSWRWSGTVYGTQASGIFTFKDDCTYTDDPTSGLRTNDEGNFVVNSSPDASITLTNKVSGGKHTYSVTKISENSFHASNSENTVNLDFFRAS